MSSDQKVDVDILAVITAGTPMRIVTSTEPASGRVSDDQYKAMTPAQKLDYARSFDQSQFLPHGRKA
jgi:hypothetical protein